MCACVRYRGDRAAGRCVHSWGSEVAHRPDHRSGAAARGPQGGPAPSHNNTHTCTDAHANIHTVTPDWGILKQLCVALMTIQKLWYRDGTHLLGVALGGYSVRHFGLDEGREERKRRGENRGQQRSREERPGVRVEGQGLTT